MTVSAFRSTTRREFQQAPEGQGASGHRRAGSDSSARYSDAASAADYNNYHDASSQRDSDQDSFHPDELGGSNRHLTSDSESEASSIIDRFRQQTTGGNRSGSTSTQQHIPRFQQSTISARGRQRSIEPQHRRSESRGADYRKRSESQEPGSRRQGRSESKGPSVRGESREPRRIGRSESKEPVWKKRSESQEPGWRRESGLNLQRAPSSDNDELGRSSHRSKSDNEFGLLDRASRTTSESALLSRMSTSDSTAFPLVFNNELEKPQPDHIEQRGRGIQRGEVVFTSSKRGDSCEPVSRRGDSREPVSRRGDSREPVSRRGESREPVTRRGESREPVGRRGESREPVSRRGESREPVSRRGESREPVSRRGESQEPVSRRGESREPVSRRGESREPVSRRGESREPVSRRGESREPVSRRGESREPVSRREESREPVSRRGESRENMGSRQRSESQEPLRGRSHFHDPVEGRRRSESQGPQKFETLKNLDTSEYLGSDLHDEERTIRAVHSELKEAEPPTGDVDLYGAMRAEVRRAVADLKSEIEQSLERDMITLAKSKGEVTEPDLRKHYVEKLEQSENRTQELLSQLVKEEETRLELSKLVGSLNTPANMNRPTEPKVKSRRDMKDRESISKALDEEAQRYFEEFASISTSEAEEFIDKRRKSPRASKRTGTTRKSPSKSRDILKDFPKCKAGLLPVNIDGVVTPWLDWETDSADVRSYLVLDDVLMHLSAFQETTFTSDINWDSLATSTTSVADYEKYVRFTEEVHLQRIRFKDRVESGRVHICRCEF